MARGKKKEKELTIEEKLEQALVPVEERPYELPENWCWVTLDSINCYSNKAVDPTKQPNTLFELYSVPSSENGYPQVILGSEIGSTKQIVKLNDVLLCKINPRINRVWKVFQYTDYPLLASSEWIIIRNSILSSDYLMYCFRAQYFREFMLSNVSGVGGSLMRAQPKYVRNYPIPLAPLAEQKRIVDCIESLFAKLDEAKEKAQAVVDGFETRKAAILHKAFTGELTARWRKERKIEYDSWIHTTIKNICNDIKVGIVIKPSQYYTTESEGIPAFRSANVREFHVENFDWVYLNEVGQRENKRSIVHTGDVLIVRSGNPGTSCVVTEEYDGYNAIDILIAVPDNKKIDSNFLCAYTNSPVCRQLIASNKRGMALSHFNVSSYSKLPIALPSLDEQVVIIYIIDKLLMKEQCAIEAAEAALDRIVAMKKSILARAFRGELGTNDPMEENAEELLKRVI